MFPKYPCYLKSENGRFSPPVPGSFTFAKNLNCPCGWFTKETNSCVGHAPGVIERYQ